MNLLGEFDQFFDILRERQPDLTKLNPELAQVCCQCFQARRDDEGLLIIDALLQNQFDSEEMQIVLNRTLKGATFDQI